ncbi:hypothetical protein HYALB_00013724 [Hymenoscyphus albidus]|uniref:Uncharacterized protein n=1 Tax=Hymenoscyphus albidus TaxID=595503 RepID=A0A9N9LXN5_9HELO|nr:hypothetical protein HYALB_00013724 [Hymenoscyphus albidus]
MRYSTRLLLTHRVEMSTTFKIPSSVLFNGQTIKQPVPKSATSVLATNLPSIAQKLAELQEINITSLRISHLKAVISKQDEKIAGILQDV